MTEVRVDPSVLHRHSVRCGEVRETLARVMADVEAETIDAARGLSGWSTARALEDALWWWRDAVGVLAGDVDGFGDALRACAANYRRSDEAAPARFL
jgi:hypothetical protein